ncbi:MAG: WGR domain-containing protein [Paracoccaceae bacterium]|nr:WGR domain-containing protein [Paracoccaceae bacterium]
MLNILLTRETRSLARFYRVELGYTLFGDYSVLREWGQAGRHGPKGGRRKLRVFTNLRDACVAAECWHRRAECRGYRKVTGWRTKG